MNEKSNLAGETVVTTKLGCISLYHGDAFQCTNSKHETCKYQFQGMTDGAGNKCFYMYDETHEKFIDVSRRWFATRIVQRIGGCKK